jgi:hypothetical protein
MDDEEDNINWLDLTQPLESQITYFNCGCCDNCTCDDQISCSCNCSCQVDDKYNLNDFIIDVIELPNKERKVRMNLNINISDNKSITISLDIESSLYLQIAKDLFN